MEIRKTKTDLIDSAIIADMLHYHEPPVATAIDNLKLYQLRELCRVRQRNVDFRKKEKKEGEVLRPGFEPESLARKARMIGRTTLPERQGIQYSDRMHINVSIAKHWLSGTSSCKHRVGELCWRNIKRLGMAAPMLRIHD